MSLAPFAAARPELGSCPLDRAPSQPALDRAERFGASARETHRRGDIAAACTERRVLALGCVTPALCADSPKDPRTASRNRKAEPSRRQAAHLQTRAIVERATHWFARRCPRTRPAIGAPLGADRARWRALSPAARERRGSALGALARVLHGDHGLLEHGVVELGRLVGRENAEQEKRDADNVKNGAECHRETWGHSIQDFGRRAWTARRGGNHPASRLPDDAGLRRRVELPQGLSRARGAPPSRAAILARRVDRLVPGPREVMQVGPPGAAAGAHAPAPGALLRRSF